ncbi:hypothetical protein IP70_22200 [alpha proteobacterium AAP38]|uniref:hypothetical protein n=1 Tax=Asticcacaulis sp. TaxID=1872648 RepID=UPI0006B97ED1|nr:hypothetical protein [Asticcacaulis sp.]KPF82190.1 hypothetical protein IP70_22200 [alpha proteobacterium AAP38]
MAPKKKYTETQLVRFLEGTLTHIDGLCARVESRADFIRLAVDKEIRHRESLAKKKSAPSEN